MKNIKILSTFALLLCSSASTYAAELNEPTQRNAAVGSTLSIPRFDPQALGGPKVADLVGVYKDIIEKLLDFLRNRESARTIPDPVLTAPTPLPIFEKHYTFSDSGRVVYTNNLEDLATNFATNKKHEQYIHLDKTTTPDEAVKIVDWVIGTDYMKNSLKGILVYSAEVKTRIEPLLTQNLKQSAGFKALKCNWWPSN